MIGRDAIEWIDDPEGPAVGRLDDDGLFVTPDGVARAFTLAALIEDEAVAYEESGTAFGAIIAGELRGLAGRVRAAGCRTPEAWLRRQGRS